MEEDLGEGARAVLVLVGEVGGAGTEGVSSYDAEI